MPAAKTPLNIEIGGSVTLVAMLNVTVTLVALVALTTGVPNPVIGVLVTKVLSAVLDVGLQSGRG